jgi:hypothetical protein
MADERPADLYAVISKQLEVMQLDLEVRKASGISLSEPDRGQINQFINYFSTGVSVQRITQGGPDMSTNEESNIAGGDIIRDSTVAGGDAAGRDMIRQYAGRDMKGVAAGERASAQSVEQISSVPEFAEALNALLEDVATSDLSAQEKAKILPVIQWWSNNVQNNNPPPEAEANLSPLAKTADWVRERFTNIFESAVGAAASHWAVGLVTGLLA